MAGKWQKAILAALEKQVRRHTQDVTRAGSVLLLNVVCEELGVEHDAVPEKALSAARRAAHSLAKVGRVSLGRAGGWVDGDRSSCLVIGLPGELKDNRLPGLREQALETVLGVVRDVANGGPQRAAQSAWVESRQRIGFELPLGATWCWWLRHSAGIYLAFRRGVEPERVRKAVDRALLEAEQRCLLDIYRGHRQLAGCGWTSRSELLFVVLSNVNGTTQQSASC